MGVSQKQQFCAVCPVIAAICFYALCPNFSHGPSWWNPLNMQYTPLDVPDGSYWTDQYLSGNVTVIPIFPEKEINSLLEAKMAPPSQGWGDDDSVGVHIYQASPELFEELCPSWEKITEEIESRGEVEVSRFAWKYGTHIVGCNNFQHVDVDIGKDGLADNEGIFFGRDADSPAWSDRLKAEIFKMSHCLTTFYHDFTNWRWTSAAHAAPSASIQVQCLGEKHWWFAAPRSMGKHGMKSRDCNIGSMWAKGFDEDMPLFLAKTKPGMIMTFPGNYIHSVLSAPGKTYMYNIRYKPKGLERLQLMVNVFTYMRGSAYHLVKSFWGLMTTTFLRLNGFIEEPDIYGPTCTENELSKEYMDRILKFHDDIYDGMKTGTLRDGY